MCSIDSCRQQAPDERQAELRVCFCVIISQFVFGRATQQFIMIYDAILFTDGLALDALRFHLYFKKALNVQ
jgi:hypothetical protein